MRFLTRDVFLVLLLVGLSFHRFDHLTRATCCRMAQKKNMIINNTYRVFPILYFHFSDMILIFQS